MSLELIQDAISAQPATVRTIIHDGYGIQKPATLETIAEAVEIHGEPLLDDLRDHVVMPYVDQILSLTDEELVNFGGGLISKIRDRRASKKSEPRERRRDRSSDGGERSGLFSRIRERRATKQSSGQPSRRDLRREAKMMKSADGQGQRNSIAGALVTGALTAADTTYQAIQSGDGIGQAIAGGLLGGASEAADVWTQPEVQYIDPGAGYGTASRAGMEKNRTLIYVGIAAAVLIVGLLIYVTTSKGKARK